MNTTTAMTTKMTKSHIEYNNEHDNNNNKQLNNFIEYHNECNK